MKQKNYITLDDEFIKYCELNDIKDIEKLAKETFNRGFTILKYGEEPNMKKNKTDSGNIKKIEKKTIDNTLPIIKKNNDLYDE